MRHAGTRGPGGEGVPFSEDPLPNYLLVSSIRASSSHFLLHHSFRRCSEACPFTRVFLVSGMCSVQSFPLHLDAQHGHNTPVLSMSFALAHAEEELVCLFRSSVILVNPFCKVSQALYVDALLLELSEMLVLCPHLQGCWSRAVDADAIVLEGNVWLAAQPRNKPLQKTQNHHIQNGAPWCHGCGALTTGWNTKKNRPSSAHLTSCASQDLHSHQALGHAVHCSQASHAELSRHLPRIIKSSMMLILPVATPTSAS